MSASATSSNDVLIKSSFSSASSLMALQLFSRVFTFILNQALFRLASPRAFGAAAIQFELMLSTILFMSREGIRNALLRVKDRTPRTMNLAFLPIALGLPLALGASLLYVRYASAEMKEQPGFESAIAIYAVAALVELLSEPMHNVAMAELKTNVRVRAEGLGVTCKSIVTFLVLLLDSRRRNHGSLALLAFAAGQLAYGTVILLTYLNYFGTKYLRPKASSMKEKGSKYFDMDILRLSLTMTSQSVVKHFLTEGDKLILSWFSPLQDQGGYAIAVNYGSLIARIVFQPVEETLRVFFSKTLPSAGSKGSLSSEALKQAGDTLISLLSIQSMFSLILIVFGTAYLPILLPILLPQQYLTTSAPQVLAAWVWYIPVLALNGGLEAFLSSVATTQDLNQQSRWMIGFSVVYISAAVTLYGLGFGDASLVYANIINLSVRIMYCLQFSRGFFNRHGAQQAFRTSNALPSAYFATSCGLSAVIIWFNANRSRIQQVVESKGRTALFNPAVLFHVALGGSLGMICLLIWWIKAGRSLSLPGHAKVE
ncbi:Rft protein-domain-containing protein [Crucibulum laeve]|uniref:Man(5)GlcNAc(2)-PP-dolichol translocation protein RFT1 n=1 Tax=Crucibulum laeve TaxID=68775 RepID=A0A5C3LWQ1_9AGAR|nr:Rft protein-domain-containing protein [Crucibulum laeve]